MSDSGTHRSREAAHAGNATPPRVYQRDEDEYGRAVGFFGAT